MKKTWCYPLPVHRFRGILRSLIFPFFVNAMLCLILFKRQYEEKQLKAQQERAQRRLEFSNQESRLMNQVSRLYDVTLYDVTLL